MGKLELALMCGDLLEVAKPEPRCL
jgi:hypothetical protein